MNRRTFIAASFGVGTAAVLGIRPFAGLAQGSPTDSIDGALLTASRTFELAETKLVGTLYYAFFVIKMESEDHAERAIPQLIARFRDSTTDPILSDFTEVSAPTIVEGTKAYTATTESDGFTVELGFLFFRVGTEVYFWNAGGLAAPTISDLAAVAERVYGSNDPTPVADLDEANILDLLPTLDDLPPGFQLGEEEVKSGDAVATPTP